MNETEEKLVNARGLVRQLARFGVTVSWLQAEADAGRLPCLRVGKRLLFNVSAVEETLLRRAGASDPEAEEGQP